MGSFKVDQLAAIVEVEGGEGRKRGGFGAGVGIELGRNLVGEGEGRKRGGDGTG